MSVLLHHPAVILLHYLRHVTEALLRVEAGGWRVEGVGMYTEDFLGRSVVTVDP